MKADFIIHQDKRFNKPFTISVVLLNDLGEVASSADIHGRFRTPSLARETAVMWANIQSYEAKWGTTNLESEPPRIITETD